MDRIQYYKVVPKDYYTDLHYYIYSHFDISARLYKLLLLLLLANNYLEACSFTARGMQILLQKLHMYKTFAKDLYTYQINLG